MKVSYTPEQKAHAIATYRRVKSYEKTLRILGYPSRHVLCEWVKNSKKMGRPKKTPPKPSKRYAWEFKLEAVQRVMAGNDIHDVADEMDVTCYALIYEWIAKYRTGGEIALMSKREKIDAGVYKTRAQLEASLPQDPKALRELAAKLLVEKAVLEEQLEMAKKYPGSIPDQLPPKIKSEITYNLKQRLPLAMLFEVLSLKPSSYYYDVRAFNVPDKHVQTRAMIHEYPI